MSDRQVKGVVFDVDGTLLDTNYLHVVAWMRALRAHGHDGVTMADIHGAIGIASDGLVKHLTGEEDEELAEAHGDFYEPFKKDIQALPGAADLLERLHADGLSVVIATSGQKDDLDWMLPAIGVEEDLIAGTATAGDVEDAKPAPELMEVAMEAAGLDQDTAVAVGDTIWDVRAANRAGIRCIGFLSGGVGEAALRDEGAVEVWKDPADLLAHLEESILGRSS